MAVAVIPVSIGELLDRYTIWTIKLERLQDPARRAVIGREHAALVDALEQLHLPPDFPELAELEKLNRELWEMEDLVRAEEAAGVFGDEFVRIARWIHLKNDARAELKRRIDLRYDSEFVTEKIYAKGPAHPSEGTPPR